MRGRFIRRPGWWLLSRRFRADMRNDGVERQASRWTYIERQRSRRAHPTARRPTGRHRPDPPRPDVECWACRERLVWYRPKGWVHADESGHHPPEPGEPWRF